MRPMGLMRPRNYVYTIAETELGWVAIVGPPEAGKVSAIKLPAPTKNEALNRLRAGMRGEFVECNHGLRLIARQVRDYFAGQRVAFVFEPDLAGLTEFQRRVLRATMTVPYGRVASYGRIAEMAGSPGAYRAVGQALGRNPIPVAIPCHRVVAGNGGLGGFSGGLDWKKKLLELEGVKL